MLRYPNALGLGWEGRISSNGALVQITVKGDSLPAQSVKDHDGENKSRRQAILAKGVIDPTGDGDLLPYAGVKFKTEMDP